MPCGEEENDESIKRAKEEQSQAEEQAQEEELEDNANDEDGAASKFSHSLDDDEDEAGENEDSKKHGTPRKHKDDDDDEDNDENEDDDEDNDDENKDEDDDNNEDSEDKGDNEDGENNDDSPNDEQDGDSQQQADDAAENLDDAARDFDEENDDQQQKQEGTDNNSSDMSSDPEPNTPPETGESEQPPGEEEPGGPTEPSETPDESEVPEGNTDTGGARSEAGAEGGAEGGADVAAEGGADAAAEGGAEAVAEGGAEAAAEAGAETAVAETAGAAEAGAAGAGVAAGAPVILIVLAVILIIFIIIGVVGFFTTVPQFLWNRFKEFVQDLWDGVQGYFIGRDEALVNKEDIIGAAQYLYDMGYDLVGMGFAESVEIVGQKDANGIEIPEDDDHQKNEIISINAPYLRSYLVAEQRTYLVTNYTFNLKNFFELEWVEEGMVAAGTGLINLERGLIETLLMPAYGITLGEANVGEAIKGVKIDRATNTMRVRRINFELAFWKTHFDYTYYSLEGWTGRYGKPFELMLTLHVATMAPDLVKEFAMNEDLDAKVNIKLRKATFGGEVCVDGTPLSEIPDGTYQEETMEWLEDFQKDKAEEIKTSMPYISSVTKHWFRNVYFEGTDSKDEGWDKVGSVDIGVDEDGDGLEDFNEATGEKTQKTRKLSSSDNVYKTGDDVAATMTYIDEDDIPSELADKEITVKGTIENGISQTKEGVRGLTNPTTKAIFKGGTVNGKKYEGKYYIYDGTVERAKAIQAARKGADNGVVKEEINLTKESLRAFSILEGSETLDAQFIYRDLKELVIEIGYFEREDFYEIEKQVLEWPVPDYIPAEWPNKEIEKQILEYGSIIACDETIAYSLGMSLEELQKLTGTVDADDDDDDDDTDDELDVLKGMTFIGDDYVLGIKNNVNIEDAEYYYEGMPEIHNQGTKNPGPQYWLDNIAQLPAELKKVIICTGAGDPREYEEMKGLIDALNKKYDYAIKIYVVEVLHVTANHTDADTYNKIIDTYNSHVRNKCKVTANATFIEASTGLLQNGYMRNGKSDGEASGRILADSEYERFVKNIAFGVNDSKYISSNPTDEQFVVDLLKAAQQVTTTIKEKEFEYGNADYMPPRTNERIDEVNGTTDEDGNKKITTDRMISWALYKCGYKDLPECGLSVGEDGDFISYLEEKEWSKITDEDDIIPGDIVFTDKIEEDKAKHVYLYAGNGKYYDCDSEEKIRQTGSTESQPIEKSLSNFMCAYRVTGDGLINSGLKKDLDVIAMGNGKVTQILNDENNLFSESYLAKTLYGDEANTNIADDEAPGREQSKEGLRIKLTDNALRGYVLVMYGFDVANNISEGSEVKAGDIIGTTLDSDIAIILIDRDKGVIEDVEEYIKIPKKTKESRTEVDWEFYYWLPYESGPLGEAGVASDTGAGSCERGVGAGEIACGIAQWTSMPSRCNNIPEICKWLYEQDPSLCAPLRSIGSWSASQVASNFDTLKDAWTQVNNANPDKFLELQFQYFYEVDFTGWVEEAGIDWMLDKALVTQGTYASLKNWGPNLGWEDVISSSMSDEEICKALLSKACTHTSTAGSLNDRWNSQYVLAKDILSGTFTEVEEWIRTKQPSDKYGEGQNNGVLAIIRKYYSLDNQIYIADIKRKYIGGIIYG